MPACGHASECQVQSPTLGQEGGRAGVNAVDAVVGQEFEIKEGDNRLDLTIEWHAKGRGTSG